MKIRMVSDLHLEMGPFTLPQQDDDNTSVLVLAGDIGLVHKPGHRRTTLIPFIEEMCNRFQQVIMVMGNHEHYGGSVLTTGVKLRGFTSHLQNFNLLDNQSILVDDVLFIGATLWTDCDKRSPYAQMSWTKMADSNAIRTGTPTHPYFRTFRASDTINEFTTSRKFIFDCVRNTTQNKIVVITHHAPCSLSCVIQDGYTMFYYSDLSNDILDTQPDLWIHGHIHAANDYNLDKTRIVSNTRGYFGHEEIVDFNPNKCVVL